MGTYVCPPAASQPGSNVVATSPAVVAPAQRQRNAKTSSSISLSQRIEAERTAKAKAKEDETFIAFTIRSTSGSRERFVHSTAGIDLMTHIAVPYGVQDYQRMVPERNWPLLK